MMTLHYLYLVIVSCVFVCGHSEPKDGRLYIKRSIHEPLEQFHLLVKANKCHVEVKDVNDDGIITRDEIDVGLADEELVDQLVAVLSGENEVTVDEFFSMAQTLMYECRLANLIPPESESLENILDINVDDAQREPNVPEEENDAQTESNVPEDEKDAQAESNVTEEESDGQAESNVPEQEKDN